MSYKGHIYVDIQQKIYNLKNAHVIILLESRNGVLNTETEKNLVGVYLFYCCSLVL